MYMTNNVWHNSVGISGIQHRIPCSASNLKNDDYFLRMLFADFAIRYGTLYPIRVSFYKEIGKAKSSALRSVEFDEETNIASAEIHLEARLYDLHLTESRAIIADLACQALAPLCQLIHQHRGIEYAWKFYCSFQYVKSHYLAHSGIAPGNPTEGQGYLTCSPDKFLEGARLEVTPEREALAHQRFLDEFPSQSEDFVQSVFKFS